MNFGRNSLVHCVFIINITINVIFLTTLIGLSLFFVRLIVYFIFLLIGIIVLIQVIIWIRSAWVYLVFFKNHFYFQPIQFIDLAFSHLESDFFWCTDNSDIILTWINWYNRALSQVMIDNLLIFIRQGFIVTEGETKSHVGLILNKAKLIGNIFFTNRIVDSCACWYVILVLGILRKKIL